MKNSFQAQELVVHFYAHRCGKNLGRFGVTEFLLLEFRKDPPFPSSMLHVRLHPAKSQRSTQINPEFPVSSQWFKNLTRCPESLRLKMVGVP